MSELIDVAVFVFVVSFLLGSIPFGLIISKLFFRTDIREHGSGNIGATNAVRALGKAGGAAVFVLDFLKGLASGFIGLWAFSFFCGLQAGGAEVYVANLDPLLGSLLLGQAHGPYQVTDYFVQVLLALSFLGCVWGHIFSPWLKFKGGKGISVAVGCVFVVYGPLIACIELAIFIVLVVATRRVSVGSIAAAAACPFFGLYVFWGNWPAVIVCALAGFTVVWAHRENIKRLVAGTEQRFGEKKDDD